MNKIFKTVWNKTRNCYVVVSEANKTFGKGKVKSISVLALAIATAFPCSMVFSKTPLPSASDVMFSEDYSYYTVFPFIEGETYFKNTVVPYINDPSRDYFISSVIKDDGESLSTIKNSVTVKDLYLGNWYGEYKQYNKTNYSEHSHDKDHYHFAYHHFESDLHLYGDLYSDLGTTMDTGGPLVVVDGTAQVEGSIVALGEFYFNNGLTVGKALFHSWAIPENIFYKLNPLRPSRDKFDIPYEALYETLSIHVYGDLTAGEIYSRSRIDVTGTTTVNNEFETEGILTTNDLILQGESQNRGEIHVKNDLTVNQSLTQTAGSLKFDKSSNVFSDLGRYDYVPLKVIGVEASTTEQAKSVTSENFKKLISGILSEEFAQKVAVNGGKVVLENTNLSNEQMEDLKRIFKQKYAGAELEFGSNTNVDFSANTVLNVAMVNKLYEEKTDFQNKTFVEDTLKGEGKEVTVGDSDDNLKHSTGFKGIDNATAINVKDGKTLELIGEEGEEPSFLMAAVKTVVNAASKLVLGSKGLSETYSGKTKEVQLADTNATLLAAAGIYEVEKVTGNGKVEVDKGAKLALAGAEHTGDLAVKGTLQVNADANLGSATLSSGSELVNGNDLKLSNIVSSDGAVYRQTGGSLKTDAGWFDNATLYISGGTIDMTKDIAGGSLKEQGLGKNTIEISGTKSNPVLKTGSSAESKANWKDGLTLVKTDVLKSESKVTVNKGGVLWAEKLEFDGSTENSLILSGGALETSLDQIFENVERDYLDLDATGPEGQDRHETHVLGATTVGKIKDSVKKGIYGESGIIVFNDQYVKMEGIIQAMQHFAAEASHPGEQEEGKPDTPSDTSGGVYLAFSGEVDAKLTVDLANKFDDEQTDVAGVVLSHTTLYNEQAGHDKETYRDLVIGYNEHEHPNSNVIDVEHGIGFLSVDGADTVHVEDGKEFVLVGHHDDDEIRTDDQREHVHSVDDSVLFNENTALIHNDKHDGGKVEVTGKFTFGSFAAHTATIGWIGEIEIHEKGQVETKNGEYAVWNIENDGNIHIDKGTVLHSHNYSGTGSWLNEGQIYLGNDHEDHSGLESQPFEVKGKFENAAGAIFSSEKKTNFIIDNELDNKGYGLYSVLTVNDSGVSSNTGVESGTEINIKGTGKHTIGEEGKSYFNKAVVGGTMENNGTLVLGKKLELDEYTLNAVSDLDEDNGFEVSSDGHFINKNILDASAVTTSNIKGEYNNIGQAQFNDVEISDNGNAVNTGTEIGKNLSVKAGSWTNQGQARYEKITDEGGTVTFDGTTQVGELVLDNGITYVKKGTTVIDKAQFNGAKLVVGNDLDETDNNAVVQAFTTDSPIGTSIEVTKNGDIRFGELAKDAIAALETDDGIPRFALSGHLTTTSTGSISVGTFLARDALSDGSMAFADDSYLVLDMQDAEHTTLNSDDMPATSFFSTESGNANLKVNEGAKLVLSRLKTPGRYLITDGFTNEYGEGDDWLGGWTGDNLSTGTLQKLWDLTLQHDDDSVWVDARLKDVRTMFPDVALPNNVNDDLNNYCDNPGAGPDAKFLCGVMHDEMLPDKEKKKIIDSVGNLGSLGGIFNSAFSDANQATNSAEGRASAMGDVFGDDGFYREPFDNDPPLPGEDGGDHYRNDDEGGHGMGENTDPFGGDDGGDRYRTDEEKNANATDGNNADGSENGKDRDKKKDGEENTRNTLNKYRGNNLWVDVLGGLRWANNMKATGTSFGYKGHSYGAVIGYDHVFYDQGLMAGIALSFDNGQLKSTGDVLPTQNKFKTYGVQLYGGWKPYSHLNVIGALGYFRSDSDITMNLYGAGGFNKATGDAKTNLMTASTRIEFPFRFRERGVVVPHIGLRYVLGKTGDYWTKLDGQKAFKNSPKATNTFQIPVGIGFREDFKLDSGWRVRPKADVSVIPQFGTKQKTTVTGITNAIEDNVEGDFTGSFGVAYSMGVQVDKKNWTIGINAGLTGGNHGQMDVNAKLEARFRF